MKKNTINKNRHDLADTAALLKNYVKRWPLFLISTILCLGLAFIFLKITNPVYQVTANILIKSEDTKGGGLQSAMMKNFSLGGLIGGASDVYDELEIVSSFSILRQTVQKLELNKSYTIVNFFKNKNCYLNSPLEISTIESIPDTLSVGLTFKIKVSEAGKAKVSVYKGRKKIATQEGNAFPIQISTIYGIFTFNKTPYYSDEKSLSMKIEYLGYDLAAENLQKEVSIGLVSKKANAINLGLEETNKQRGKDILNMIIHLYNENGISEKQALAANTAKFLDERIEIISRDLAIVERKVELYKKANILTDIEAEAKIMIEKNGDFKEQMIAAETQYSVIALIENFITSPQNQYTLVPLNLGITDKTIAEGLQNYNSLLLERLKLLRSTNEQNPAILLMNEQVAAVRENVISTIKSIKSGIGIAINDLKKQEDAFMSRIKGMPTQEREFIDLKRQQMIKQELFVFLLQRKEENAIALSATTPKAQVIDKAYSLNEPISPKKKVIAVLFLLIGLLIPVLYLYLKEILNTKFVDKTELEELTTIPVLGEICVNDSGQSLVVKDGISSSISELFRLIRSNLQFILRQKNGKVILVTSSVSGEGKSFISSNLALSLSLLKKKVVLVGLDIRNPQLHDIFRTEQSNQGLTVYLSSENCSYRDIVTPSKESDNLYIIYSGPIPPNPSELLLSEKLDNLFNYLREQYDYIVVDSAPVGMISDTFSLNRFIDTTVYVCRANYTTKENIRFVNSLQESDRLKNISFVINGTTAKQGYGYNKK